jgi:cbb3-type cytochrome oxidase subunit 1
MDYRLSNRFLRLAVLFALIGMGLGYWMGATEQFAAAPVHAHINLLGWVSMALYGLFYRVQPSAAQGWLPAVHFWVAVVGLVIFMPALAAKLLGGPDLQAMANLGLMVGPSLTLLSMLLFVAIVFRATGPRSALA